MADAYAHHYANVHRGIYELSEDATSRFEAARRKVAAFLGAPSEREIVFVRNATEAINLVAFSWGRTNVAKGDRIVTTQLEHHANIVPWQQLTRRGRRHARLRRDHRRRPPGHGRPARQAGRASEAGGGGHGQQRAGHHQPASARSSRLAHEAGALVLVDAAQAAPHMPIDIKALDCDFLAISGHKMLGPSGIGALWGRRELLDAMPPFMTGGSMIIRVTLEGAEWNEVPAKFEAGTPAIVEAIGLGAAIDYLTDLGMDNVREHERYLFERGLAGAGRDPRRAAVRTGRSGDPRRRDQLRAGRGASARRGHHLRPRGRGGPGRPPLRAAGDAALRHPGHHPRQLLRLQRPG